jgi:hypothetical protein
LTRATTAARVAMLDNSASLTPVLNFVWRNRSSSEVAQSTASLVALLGALGRVRGGRFGTRRHGNARPEVVVVEDGDFVAVGHHRE